MSTVAGRDGDLQGSNEADKWRQADVPQCEDATNREDWMRTVGGCDEENSDLPERGGT